MPSVAHEALVLLFRNRPELAAELVAASGAAGLPPYRDARITSIDRTDTPPATRLADVVVELRTESGRVGAIVVEVQLQMDRRKRFTWPLYVASVRDELRCDALLLVITPDEAVERWASAPIVLGHPGLVLSPIVLGPSAIPAITDLEQAERSIELAVLSAIAHGRGQRAYEVGGAVLCALEHVDEPRGTAYTMFVLPALDDAVRARLEEEMKLESYPEQPESVKRILAQGREEGREEGRAQGELHALVTSVIRFLEARGVAVSPDDRERILACTDPQQASRWVARAATVSTTDELFE